MRVNRLRAAIRFSMALIVAPSICQLVAAAELPSRRAVERPIVKSCASYGAGFVWAPAVNSCIKLGGSVAAEYTATPRSSGATR